MLTFHLLEIGSIFFFLVHSRGDFVQQACCCQVSDGDNCSRRVTQVLFFYYPNTRNASGSMYNMSFSEGSGSMFSRGTKYPRHTPICCRSRNS
uniref:Putative secreted protein n=1 Tax=Ixodes ricinus TaxID=34613 RepID=A0A6B0U8A2_IXORI